MLTIIPRGLWDCGVGRQYTFYICVNVMLLDLLVINEKWCNKEHLEEAAKGTDLYGVESLNCFHQENNDGEEYGGQKSIEQTETGASLWFLCV